MVENCTNTNKNTNQKLTLLKFNTKISRMNQYEIKNLFHTKKFFHDFKPFSYEN